MSTTPDRLVVRRVVGADGTGKYWAVVDRETGEVIGRRSHGRHIAYRWLRYLRSQGAQTQQGVAP